MGFSLSCFRQQSSSPQRLADQEAIKRDQNRSSPCSDASFMMFGCFPWAKETKKRPLQLKEKQRKQQNLKKAKQVTLEDWLIASPAGKLQRNNHDNFGGEYHNFKHSSKRVFPSFVGDMAAANSSSIVKPRECFSKERSLMTSEDVQREDMEICLSRSQSGKSKKRVSFKLPEEADIFIFHPSSSSGEESGEQGI